MLIDYFSDLIRRQQRMQRGFGVFVLLPALTGLVLSVLADGGWGLRACCAAFGILLLIPGVLLIRRGVMAPANHPALRLLLERPSDVVWVFPLRHMNQAAASHVASDLVVCSREGRKIRLPCIPLEEDRALEMVAAQVPHAVLGFSDELRRQFKKDPTQLCR